MFFILLATNKAPSFVHKSSSPLSSSVFFFCESTCLLFKTRDSGVLNSNFKHSYGSSFPLAFDGRNCCRRLTLWQTYTLQITKQPKHLSVSCTAKNLFYISCFFFNFYWRGLQGYIRLLIATGGEKSPIDKNVTGSFFLSFCISPSGISCIMYKCNILVNRENFLQQASLSVSQMIPHITKLSCVGSCQKHFCAFQ